MSASPAQLARDPSSATRVVGVDVARGLAVLGMMAAHILVSDDERIYDGRSSILFATIAGVTLGISTASAANGPRSERGRARIRLAVRAAAILVIGLALSTLPHRIAVILDEYAVYFLLLIPLLLAPRRVLIPVAAGVLAVGPPLVAWASERADRTGDPLLLNPIAEWLLTGYYPAAVWLAYLLVGLAFARSDLGRWRTRLVMLVGGSAVSTIGYALGALVPGMTAEAHSDTLAEALGSGGLAIAIIGLLTILLDGIPHLRSVARVALWPIAVVGSIPLTVYTLHVIGMSIAHAASIATTGSSGNYPGWLYPAMVAGAVLLGAIVRLTGGRGPLEAGIRWLSTAATTPMDELAVGRAGGTGRGEGGDPASPREP